MKTLSFARGKKLQASLAWQQFRRDADEVNRNTLSAIRIIYMYRPVARIFRRGGYMGVIWVSTNYTIYPISPLVFRKMVWLQTI